MILKGYVIGLVTGLTLIAFNIKNVIELISLILTSISIAGVIILVKG